MSAADKIANARALIEPLTGHTPGAWEIDAPKDESVEIGAGSFSIAGLYEAAPDALPDARLIAAAPVLRDTVADLTDLADAQAQENARLRGLLWYAWHEFNAIRARDGAPRGSDTCCGRLGPTLVSEEWWNTLTEAFADAIGTDARTPWPSPEAKDVGETLKAKT